MFKFKKYLKAKFSGKLSREEKNKLKALEKRLGVSFCNRHLLKQALTHKSYTNEKKLPTFFHNERLEYLGDAVLELVVSDVLMHQYPLAAEGELSKIRASMVNEKTLSEIAKNLRIGEMLYLGKGEELGQGREKASLLADAFEAILGAIYLDNSYRQTLKVVKKHALFLLELVNEQGVYKDYKTLLQEFVQNTYKTIPRYAVVGHSGPDHDKIFDVEIRVNQEVIAQGSGKNKKEAEQTAAQIALSKLKGDV